MHDARGMRGAERIRDLTRNVQRFERRDRFTTQLVAQRDPLDVLHRDEVPVVLGHSGLVDHADVGMVQG